MIFEKVSEKIESIYRACRAFVRRVRIGQAFNTVRREIHGRNNIILYKNAGLFSVLFDIRGDGNRVEIKADSMLKNVEFQIRGNNHLILIENGCQFKRGGSILVEDNDCTLVIGEHSTFSWGVYLTVTEPGSQIRIGRDCMFAYDIDVRTGDSHSIISLESKKRINPGKDVSIGDHVWIGAHSVLLKGASIPNDSIVATCSVVTGRFGTNGIIIGGNPARQLKKGITWRRERIPCLSECDPLTISAESDG